MIRNKDNEAREYLEVVYKQVMEIHRLMADVGTEGQPQPSLKYLQLPSIDFRLQTCRLLVELEDFKKVVKLLDNVVQEDDSIVESWYLLCFSFVRLSKF